MKWIIVWFGFAATVLGVAAVSCSINHRSGQFECETTADCDSGRTCSEGLCTTNGVPDSGIIDAPKKDGGLSDASVCPPGCTSCGPNKVCIIDCAVAGSNCGSQLTCPAGWNCDLRCSTDSACRNGVNCTAAASCTFQCTGRNSCRGIACGPGVCNVSCTATGSCETVTCGVSCACDVRCSSGASCASALCTRPECDTGRGCSSSVAQVCETCP